MAPELTETRATRRFADVYARRVGALDAHFLSPLRSELLAPLTGRILEIGAGAGSNLPHYADGTDVVLAEPFPAMRAHLERAVRDSSTRATVTVSPDRAEALTSPDSSVDAVVSTLVLCSVDDPGAALREVRRVIAPGGVFAFLEHSRGEGIRALTQRTLEPLQRHFVGNCHLTRDMPELIGAAGFSDVTYRVTRRDETPLPIRLAPPAPFLLGTARA